MQVGDLVTIYYMSRVGHHRLVDTKGIVTEKHGHKCTVLVEGKLDVWDKDDLRKMEVYKNEAR